MSAQTPRDALRARVEQRPVGSDALESLRAEASRQFLDSDWPGERLEAWRFTDLRALDRLDWDRSDATAALPPDVLDRVPGLPADADRLVFQDGALVPDLSRSGSLPAGVRLTSLRVEGAHPGLGDHLDLKARALSALNTALFEDGARIEVPDEVVLERPLALVWLTSGERRLVNPRTQIRLGARSRARVLELHAATATGGAFINPVSEVWLDPGARLDHVHLQEQGPHSAHLAELAVHQEAGSELHSHSLALGGALARLEIRTALAGEGAHARLHGLYRGRGSQLLDHHTTIDHAAPHTTSEELYKGILDGRAKGVFCGCVHVRPHAQKIDATQTNRALLLTDSATVHTRPQLEIYADDVRCSHGASIGQLDGDALFYLRARGISLADARALLTAAFVEDVLGSLPCEGLSEHVRAGLLDPDRLEPGGGR